MYNVLFICSLHISCCNKAPIVSVRYLMLWTILVQRMKIVLFNRVIFADAAISLVATKWAQIQGNGHTWIAFMFRMDLNTPGFIHICFQIFQMHRAWAFVSTSFDTSKNVLNALRPKQIDLYFVNDIFHRSPFILFSKLKAVCSSIYNDIFRKMFSVKRATNHHIN